jgi:hypothetical protein
VQSRNEIRRDLGHPHPCLPKGKEHLKFVLWAGFDHRIPQLRSRNDHTENIQGGVEARVSFRPLFYGAAGRFQQARHLSGLGDGRRYRRGRGTPTGAAGKVANGRSSNPGANVSGVPSLKPALAAARLSGPAIKSWEGVCLSPSCSFKLMVERSVTGSSL